MSEITDKVEQEYDASQIQVLEGLEAVRKRPGMLALVDNQTQPKILSLRHILDAYLAYQEEIIVRRTKYDLRKAEERAHLLEGLLIAQDNIDEVVHIIRSSYDNAKQNLMDRFGLDDVQAQAICDMRLIALQGLNREKLEAEYRDLELRIAEYKTLLADPEKIRAVLETELLEIRDKYGDGRLTEIEDVWEDIDDEDLIAEEDCVFTLTHNGYIKRLETTEYNAQKRGGKGVRAMKIMVRQPASAPDPGPYIHRILPEIYSHMFSEPMVKKLLDIQPLKKRKFL